MLVISQSTQFCIYIHIYTVKFAGMHILPWDSQGCRFVDPVDQLLKLDCLSQLSLIYSFIYLFLPPGAHSHFLS